MGILVRGVDDRLLLPGVSSVAVVAQPVVAASGAAQFERAFGFSGDGGTK
jgi:hypothetical protein